VTRVQKETNLEIVLKSLEDYAQLNVSAVATDVSARADHLSGSLFLAHSTSDRNFSAICAGGYIASAQRLAAGSGKAPGKTELELGTAGSVFFYVSPFRYPNTSCGLLFRGTLEQQHREDGAASPFDSGALMRPSSTREDMAEAPKAFFSRHELPIPDHRKYLALSMKTLFQRPADYIDGARKLRGPLGFSAGADEDRRVWTHEVRIPDRVFARSSHLEAVFAPKARVAADPGIENLFQWCLMENVNFIAFDIPRDGDFEGLRRECLAYVNRRLGLY
jgi:hypothetical protein